MLAPLDCVSHAHCVSHSRLWCGGQARGGVIYGEGQLLGAALLFIVASVCWVGSTSFGLFMLLRKLGVLRVGNVDVMPDSSTGSILGAPAIALGMNRRTSRDELDHAGVAEVAHVQEQGKSATGIAMGAPSPSDSLPTRQASMPTTASAAAPSRTAD